MAAALETHTPPAGRLKAELTTADVHGFCDVRFLPLRDAFVRNLEDGLEIGASLSATWCGRTVVDLWAGFADEARTRPWTRDTIACVFSTTKIMAILCTLMLVDRGLIELDAPVSRYWPEFAQGGKGDVTIRDALTHQAGVPGFATQITMEMTYDWDAITTRIAAEPHWFGGRRVLAYHWWTYGFVLGEVIRRIDGRKPGQFFREEIANPAGVDFQIGLTSRADVDRLAKLHFGTPPPPLADESVAARANASIAPGDMTSWAHLSTDNAAGNGYGNGRSIARACAIIAMRGELDGVRYLSPAIVEEAGAEQLHVEDENFGWIRLGLGLGMDSAGFRAPSPTSLHWGGHGGSWGLMDPAVGFSLGFAPNNMISVLTLDPRIQRFCHTLEKLLPTLSAPTG